MSKKVLSFVFTTLMLSMSVVTVANAQGFFELSPEDRAKREEERMKVEADLRAKMDLRVDERQNSLDARIETRKTEMEDRLEARKAEMEARREEFDAKREAFVEERKAKIEEFRAEAEAKRAEALKRGTEALKEVVTKQTENAKRVMTATVERLEGIALRIDSRIEKVKARGGDTSEAERLVAQARTNLDSAKVKIEALATIELTGEKVEDNFKIVREAGKEIKDLLKSVHEDLVSAVRSLSDVEASVTIETSTETTVQSEQ